MTAAKKDRYPLPIVNKIHITAMAEGYAEGYAQGHVEGFAEGYALHEKRLAEAKTLGEQQAILAILAARGFQVGYYDRQRIDKCVDSDLLKKTKNRALSIEIMDYLFD